MYALVLAAAEKDQQTIFNEVLSHLSPHKYTWAPEWKVGPIDLTFSNAVLNIWLSAAIVLVLFWLAASKPKLVPRGVQNAIEAAMDWAKSNLVYSVMSPKDGATWGPLVLTLFFFILIMNVIGLIPVIGFTPTSNIYLTATLAFMVYLIAVIVGMAKNGPLKFWKKTLLPEGVNKGIAILMAILIEPISQLARPFSLAVRLFANMLADHLLLLIFAGFIFIASGVILAIVLPISVVFMIIFTAFAILVAFIQAVVFAYLSAIYINDALHPGH
jgi:F-type H+-transporting ATPase subunit a